MTLHVLSPVTSRPGVGTAARRRAVVVAVLLGAATSTACSGPKVEPLSSPGAAATVQSPSGSAAGTRTTERSGAASTTARGTAVPPTSTLSTVSPSATSPTSTADGSGVQLPAPTGGRLFSDPDEEIRVSLGDQFAVSLPAPTNAKAWIFHEKGCINVQVLDVKTQSSGRVIYAMLWDVAGACHLDFHDTDTPNFEATPDIRFDAMDADL